jgi:hypothetical protein
MCAPENLLPNVQSAKNFSKPHPQTTPNDRKLDVRAPLGRRNTNNNNRGRSNATSRRSSDGLQMERIAVLPKEEEVVCGRPIINKVNMKVLEAGRWLCPFAWTC